MAAIIKSTAWKEFFQLYKQLESLWIPSSSDWVKSAQKEKDWQILLKKYQQIDASANLASLKAKVNNLRTCYRRELKKILQRPSYEPNLWYFSELDFLREYYLAQYPKTENAKICSIKMENGVHASSSQAQSTVSLKISRTVDDDNGSDPHEKDFTEMDPLMYESEHQPSHDPQWKVKGTKTARKEPHEERDEADIYAENWAAQFRKLNDVQKLFAKKCIEDILFLGQLQQLNLNTVRMPSDESVCMEADFEAQ